MKVKELKKKYAQESEELVESNVAGLWTILPRNVLIIYRLLIGKWFEPRSISYLSCVIVRVRVAFRKTVVVNYKHLNNLSGIYKCR